MSLPIYLMSNFPSVRPSLNLQFDSQPTPADMTSHLASVGATFSRASIGTYTDANGLVAEATAGQARPNYSNAGVHEGLLIEESRTNLFQSSEGFDDTTIFVHNRITVTEEAIINPKGTARAFRFSETTESGRHNLSIITAYRPTLTNGTKYTQSFFVKKGDGATAPDIIQIVSGTSLGSGYQNFNISTGSILSGDGDSATIEDVGNGWYRISMTDTAVANDTSTFLLAFTNNANSGRLPSYAGQTDADIYVWGAQMEEGSFPTSYIPTIPTFTDRDSVATFLGSDGLIQTASVDVARSDTYVYVDDVLTEAGLLLEGSAENLVTSSEDFSTDYTGNLGTITVNQAIAPDGTASADLIQTDDASAHNIKQDIAIISGESYSYSVFFKAGTYDIVRIGNYQSSTNGIWFNLTSGTVGTENGGSGQIIDYGNGWYRCIANFTSVNTSSSKFFWGMSASDGSTSAPSVGSTVYAWGAQAEAGSQATSYFPTERSFTSRASSATFFNASGVLSTASTNVARTDHKYIGGQWVEAGLLLEGASTNLLLRSQDLSATWDTTNTSVTVNQVNGLDGTLSADLLKENSNNSTHYISQSGTFSSGTTYTFSTFAKNASGTRYLQLRVFGIGADHAFVNFDLVNGEIPTSGSGGADLISATIEDVGNGWYRCSMTGNYSETPTGFLLGVSNSATAELPIYTGDGTSGFYIWGTQAEAQNQATSYIKTVSSTADRAEDFSSAKSSADRTRDADSYTTATKVRSADVCTITGTAFTDFYNQEQGTFFAEARSPQEGSKGASILGSNQDNQSLFFRNNIPRISLGEFNVGDANLNLPSGVTAFDFIKVGAVLYADGSEKMHVLNSVKTNTNVAFSSYESLLIGDSRHPSSIGYLNGTIKKLIYFPRSLSDNELIKLTQ